MQCFLEMNCGNASPVCPSAAPVPAAGISHPTASPAGLSAAGSSCLPSSWPIPFNLILKRSREIVHREKNCFHKIENLEITTSSCIKTTPTEPRNEPAGLAPARVAEPAQAELTAASLRGTNSTGIRGSRRELERESLTCTEN